MKKSLKVLLFILTISVLVLSACGGGNQQTTEEPVVEEPTEAPVAEEPTEAPVAEEPTEAPAEEPLGEPLKIGVMSDLTGGLALFGNEMWQGLQLGFEYATDGTMVAGKINRIRRC